MPDILFLEVNSSYSHSMLSYGMLRAYTEQFAPEWRWHKLEFFLRRIDEAPLIDTLRQLRPAVVCATAYLFNIEALLALARTVRRELPETKIVLGGPEFLGGNEEFLEAHPEIDAVMRGDETTFYRYLQHGEIADGNFGGELDDLPSPHQLGYISPEKPFWQLETSRGCGGRCVFCSSALTGKVKYHSLPRVRADLAALHNAGFRDIRLLDRTFNRNQRRATELLKLFRTEFPDMRFHLEIEPAGLSPEFLAEMARGNLHVEAGVQSLNPRVLSACCRHTEPEEVLNGLRDLIGCGNFEVHIDLIAGLPEQTLESLLEDVNTLVPLHPGEIQLETLKILPGTPLRRNTVDFNRKPPYEILSSAAMRAEDLRAAVRLSQILDGWFNARQLRSAFIRAVKEDSGFPGNFLMFLLPREKIFSSGKPPLEQRFQLLRDFLPDGPAREVLRFAAFAEGIDGGVVRRKIDELKGEIRTIWRKSGVNPPERYFIVGFSGNAGECWADPKIEWQAGEREYCFKLHYGRLPSEIGAMLP